MNAKQGTNMQVKKDNRNRVFRYIRKQGTVSNPDISYATKMSLPTVTMMTKELIEQGLVEEIGELQSTGGRRAKALAVSVNARQAAGLDITRNHIGLALTNLAGEMLEYKRMYLPYADAAEYYNGVKDRMEAFLESCGVDRERILGIGISFPGIIDLKKEQIAKSHVLGVKALPFSSVSRFFSYPCYFQNDANAGAYAEGMHAEPLERFFYLSLSNTVGGAFYSGGRLEQGTNFRCGEVGHMTVVPDGERCYCGKSGCLDAYCSANRLSDLTGGKLREFFLRLEQKDAKAADVWDSYTTYLSLAVNNIYMVLDCDIILGGYVGSCIQNHMQDIREKVLQRNTFQEEASFVRRCSYQEGAAALGAALAVTETFIEQI